MPFTTQHGRINDKKGIYTEGGALDFPRFKIM